MQEVGLEPKDFPTGARRNRKIETQRRSMRIIERFRDEAQQVKLRAAFISRQKKTNRKFFLLKLYKVRP